MCSFLYFVRCRVEIVSRGSVAWLKQEVAFFKARRDLLMSYTQAAVKLRASLDDQLARAHAECSDAALKKEAASFQR